MPFIASEGANVFGIFKSKNIGTTKGVTASVILRNQAIEAKGLSSECVDSLKITSLLDAVAKLPASENKLLFFAKGFLGTPYKSGTLETFPFEQLVIRTDSVDCTTFVEYVLALYCVDKQNDLDNPYATFKQFLSYIRYRGGHLQGYTSRLHYFSDWIADNERKGLLHEVTKDSPHSFRSINLNFMSQHASLYPFLAKDNEELVRMRVVEERWKNYQMPYIPKQQLDASRNTLKINDGDILTIVTNIKGLDVVHVGFAYWIEGKLHLLHASSAKKYVLLDPIPLFQYSRNKSSHIGIRAVRVVAFS